VREKGDDQLQCVSQQLQLSDRTDEEKPGVCEKGQQGEFGAAIGAELMAPAVYSGEFGAVSGCETTLLGVSGTAMTGKPGETRWRKPNSGEEKAVYDWVH
jgi:hypothetical protein